MTPRATYERKQEQTEALQQVMRLIHLNQSLLEALRDSDHDKVASLDQEIDHAHMLRERTVRDLQRHVRTHGC